MTFFSEDLIKNWYLVLPSSVSLNGQLNRSISQNEVLIGFELEHVPILQIWTGIPILQIWTGKSLAIWIKTDDKQTEDYIDVP